ncbi:MAG TPA: type II toxin-antitoxin system HicB family antitoxin [Nitrososphaera sp.]|nr:type II toxin-antitoxin system HicB family antitoxin [Nitrososphaera sp.]
MRDQPHAVKVPVTASVPVECLFWNEDDGWKGSCAELALAVSGNSFEDAKKNMEAALQTCIESVLRNHKMAA